MRESAGREHPDTLTSMNNLARVLSEQGKYEQAEEMHQQTLRLMEITLGKEHPHTLTSRNNLAAVLRDQGGRGGISTDVESMEDCAGP